MFITDHHRAVRGAAQLLAKFYRSRFVAASCFFYAAAHEDG
jgi:hypothetical protein